MKKTDASNISGADESRRRFFVGASTAIGAVALASVLPRQARADDLPHLSPTDATAQTLGYVEDATKADKAKFPTYTAGNTCANCNFYQGGAAVFVCDVDTSALSELERELRGVRTAMCDVGESRRRRADDGVGSRRARGLPGVGQREGDLRADTTDRQR